MTATLRFEPLGEAFGMRVHGLDLTRPLPEHERRQVLSAYESHRLLVLHAPQLGSVDQARFGRLFGDIAIRQDYETPPSLDQDSQYVSNTRDDGIIGSGPLGFHHDQLFMDEPFAALMLHTIETPPMGGETKFANSSMAHAAMPADLQRRVAGLTCLHVYDFKADYSRPADPDSPTACRATHPLIHRDPATGQPAVWVNTLSTARVNEVEANTSRALIEEVRSYVGREDAVYRHRWKPGDLIVWDNRMVQHGRESWDPGQPRTLRRTPIVPFASRSAR